MDGGGPEASEAGPLRTGNEKPVEGFSYSDLGDLLAIKAVLPSWASNKSRVANSKAPLSLCILSFFT